MKNPSFGAARDVKSEHKAEFSVSSKVYIAKHDDKYLMWFLHYYDPVLNDTSKEDVEKLDYKERLVVSEYLEFCPDCFKLKSKKVKFSEMAVKLCFTPDAIENVYKKAIRKMRKHLEEKLP